MVILYLFQISEDAELLWRLARASRDIAQLSGTSEEEKKLLVYEALEYAKRALEKNESSFAAHKVRCLKVMKLTIWGVHWSVLYLLFLFTQERRKFVYFKELGKRSITFFQKDVFFLCILEHLF